MRWEIAIALGLAAGTIGLSEAEADEPAPCGAPGHPWVEVRSSDGNVAFESLLRAELAPRRIDLCPSRGEHGAPAIASVEIASRGEGAVIVVLVRDAVTAKRVERDVELGGVPRDGRSLTLALAADELLRASWAELALSGAPPPAAPVPLAVRDEIDASVSTPRRPPRAAFGAQATTEHYSGGQTLYGADLDAALWITRRFSAEARLGLRSALSASAPDGDVRATAFVAGLGASATATPLAWAWGLDAVARFDLERVSYLAVPKPGATAASEAATAFLACAGGRLTFSVVGPLRLLAEVLVDVPVRPVRATDSGGEVVGIEGVGVSAALGARTVF